MSNGDRNRSENDHVWKSWEWELWGRELAERRRQVDLRFRKRLVIVVTVGVALHATVQLVVALLT